MGHSILGRQKRMRMHFRRNIVIASLSLLVTGASDAKSIGSKRMVDPSEVIALEKGVWDAEITSWPRKPGGAPTRVTGVQVNEPRSGGTWMLNRMSVNGGAYEGTGIWGYDRQTGHYSGTWADSNSPRIRRDDGSWNPETKTMTWSAEVEAADGRKVRMLATSTFLGNTRTYRSFAITEAGIIPLSTVVFTRRRDMGAE